MVSGEPKLFLLLMCTLGTVSVEITEVTIAEMASHESTVTVTKNIQSEFTASQTTTSETTVTQPSSSIVTGTELTTFETTATKTSGSMETTAMETTPSETTVTETTPSETTVTETTPSETTGTETTPSETTVTETTQSETTGTETTPSETTVTETTPSETTVTETTPSESTVTETTQSETTGTETTPSETTVTETTQSETTGTETTPSETTVTETTQSETTGTETTPSETTVTETTQSETTGTETTPSETTVTATTPSETTVTATTPSQTTVTETTPAETTVTETTPSETSATKTTSFETTGTTHSETTVTETTVTETTAIQTTNKQTTIPPTIVPSPPSRNRYVVTQGDVTCLVMEATIGIDIEYQSKHGPRTMEMYIPKGAEKAATGVCDTNRGRNVLRIPFFGATWCLTLTIGTSLGWQTTVTSDVAYSWREIDLVYIEDKERFPDAVEPSDIPKHLHVNLDGGTFPATNTTSYKCNVQTKVALDASNSLEITELQYRALGQSNNDGFISGDVIECDGDKRLNDTGDLRDFGIVFGSVYGGFCLLLALAYAGFKLWRNRAGNRTLERSEVMSHQRAADLDTELGSSMAKADFP